MFHPSCPKRLLPWSARVVFLGLLGGLVASLGFGDQKQTFEDESKVVLVEVPVRVVLDGQPLTGLTAKDFVVYDRGEIQEITNLQVFDFREIPGNPLPISPLGPSDMAPKRNLVFLFDFAYPAGFDPVRGAGFIVAAVRGLHANSQSLEFLVESHLKARDRWAVAFFSPLRNVKLLQGWTEDSIEVSQALQVLDAAILAEPELVDAPKGARVIHRRGYYAPEGSRKQL
jgi:hypothetical protein